MPQDLRWVSTHAGPDDEVSRPAACCGDRYAGIHRVRAPLLVLAGVLLAAGRDRPPRKTPDPVST